jgi:hypothetical protein
MRFRLIFVAILVTLFHCRSGQSRKKYTFENVAVVHAGKNFLQQKNREATHSLVHSADTSATQQYFNYAIITLKNNNIVVSGRYRRGGYARWLSNGNVEVFTVPAEVQHVTDSSIYKTEIILNDLRK